MHYIWPNNVINKSHGMTLRLLAKKILFNEVKIPANPEAYS